jgi:hypothetical protein
MIKYKGFLKNRRKMHDFCIKKTVHKQRYRYSKEITHDPLLLSVAQGIFCLSTERLSRSTLHLKEGEGEGSLYSCI